MESSLFSETFCDFEKGMSFQVAILTKIPKDIGNKVPEGLKSKERPIYKKDWMINPPQASLSILIHQIGL